MEHKIIIDGIEYDTRNVSDLQYLESIGYFDKNKKEDKVESKTTINVNEKEGWNCPMNTEYIKDKKMDYETLGLITLYSNYKSETVCEEEGLSISDVEYHRYIYEKGSNSINSNMRNMEKISKNKRRNIKRNIKKLTECNNRVVEVCSDINRNIYYKINPYANSNECMGKFVVINNKMLEYLIHTGNSNMIKTYCMIKVLLWDDKNKCYIKRQITRDFLLKQIGLSNCEKNLQQMTDILKSLTANNFIKREKNVNVTEVNGEGVVRIMYTYELVDDEEWFKYYKKL